MKVRGGGRRSGSRQWDLGKRMGAGHAHSADNNHSSSNPSRLAHSVASGRAPSFAFPHPDHKQRRPPVRSPSATTQAVGFITRVILAQDHPGPPSTPRRDWAGTPILVSLEKQSEANAKVGNKKKKTLRLAPRKSWFCGRRGKTSECFRHRRTRPDQSSTR